MSVFSFVRFCHRFSLCVALLVNQWETVEHIGCGVANFTCPKNGTEVLINMNFEPANFTMDIAILFVMILVFRVIAYTALYFRTQK
jgi:ATP-binding cassette, subfamily G (WHITE), eye pigment precursor transporter